MHEFLSVAEASVLYDDLPITAKSNCCTVTIDTCRCICEQMSKRICTSSIECIQKCTVHLIDVNYEEGIITAWYEIMLYYVDSKGRKKKVKETDSMTFAASSRCSFKDDFFQVCIPESICATICCDEVLVGFFIKLYW